MHLDRYYMCTQTWLVFYTHSICTCTYILYICTCTHICFVNMYIHIYTANRPHFWRGNFCFFLCFIDQKSDPQHWELAFSPPHYHHARINPGSSLTWLCFSGDLHHHRVMRTAGGYRCAQQRRIITTHHSGDVSSPFLIHIATHTHTIQHSSCESADWFISSYNWSSLAKQEPWQNLLLIRKWYFSDFRCLSSRFLNLPNILNVTDFLDSIYSSHKNFSDDY